MTLKYTISRKELSKKKPKVLEKNVSGAQDEHRNAEPIITVLKRMKAKNNGMAG